MPVHVRRPIELPPSDALYNVRILEDNKFYSTNDPDKPYFHDTPEVTISVAEAEQRIVDNHTNWTAITDSQGRFVGYRGEMPLSNEVEYLSESAGFYEQVIRELRELRASAMDYAKEAQPFGKVWGYKALLATATVLNITGVAFWVPFLIKLTTFQAMGDQYKNEINPAATKGIMRLVGNGKREAMRKLRESGRVVFMTGATRRYSYARGHGYYGLPLLPIPFWGIPMFFLRFPFVTPVYQPAMKYEIDAAIKALSRVHMNRASRLREKGLLLQIKQRARTR